MTTPTETAGIKGCGADCDLCIQSLHCYRVMDGEYAYAQAMHNAHEAKEREEAFARQHPFDCPFCATESPYVNAGKTHIGYCEPCGISWIVGANLFDSWQNESEAEQRAKYVSGGIETLRRI